MKRDVQRQVLASRAHRRTVDPSAVAWPVAIVSLFVLLLRFGPELGAAPVTSSLSGRELVVLLVGAISAAACLRAAGAASIRRGVWTAMGAALCAKVGADAAYAVADSYGLPSWIGDAFTAPALILLTVAVLRAFPTPDGTPRRQAFTDAVTLAAGVGACTWTFVVSPAVAQGAEMATLLGLAGLSNLALVTVLVLAGSFRDIPPTVKMLVVLLGVIAASDLLYAGAQTAGATFLLRPLSELFDVLPLVLGATATLDVRHPRPNASPRELASTRGVFASFAGTCLATAGLIIQTVGASAGPAIAFAVCLSLAVLGVRISILMRAQHTVVRRLNEAIVKHRRLARTDPLTGVENRRSFDEALERELQRSRRGAVSALAVLDVDHFKRINDQYGHAVGDEVLKAVADRLKRSARSHDVVARIGGEEFAALLVDVEPASVTDAGHRLLAAIRNDVQTSAGPLRVTASLGLAVASGSDTADELLRAADRRLYAAKLAGRDRMIAGERQAEVAG